MEFPEDNLAAGLLAIAMLAIVVIIIIALINGWHPLRLFWML